MDPIPPLDLEELTYVQRLVMERLACGLTNSAIATELNVTERAVEKHVTHVLWTMGMFDGRNDRLNPRVVIAVAFLRGSSQL